MFMVYGAPTTSTPAEVMDLLACYPRAIVKVCGCAEWLHKTKTSVMNTMDRERDLVREAQGPCIPYTSGVYLSSLLLPRGLQHLKRKEPIPKPKLELIFGRPISELEYGTYMRHFE